jgi:hypothetical protein
MPATLSPDLITGAISFLLTLMVLSYVIGDNPLFRLAVYLFVGVSAGYAAAVAWWQVLFPRLWLPLVSGSFFERVFALIALILGVLLLMKLGPRTAALGNPSIAFLVGVSAAVAVGGAVMGTILPQAQASINVYNLAGSGKLWLERFLFGTLTLAGTLTTLVYFHFGARATPDGPKRNKLVLILSWIGQIFIAITLGVLFAGVFSASMTALVERLNSIWSFFANLFKLL